MAARAKERPMARRSSKSRSTSRLYAEQIVKSATALAHAAISVAHLMDRVDIDESLGKRLGPRVRGVRDLVDLATAELRAARLEHLAERDPLAQDGRGAELASALAEQAESCRLSWQFNGEPLLKRRRPRAA